jgi:hypothetical protein
MFIRNSAERDRNQVKYPEITIGFSICALNAFVDLGGLGFRDLVLA